MGAREVGKKNLTAVRAYFASHLCATQRECSKALGLDVMAVNRHVKTIRAESALQEEVDADEASPPKRQKFIHTGAPKCFDLELACQQISDAFGDDGFGCYVVGSALERPDWRDIDVRLIMSDEAFDRLFPDAGGAQNHQEHDARWLIMTSATSAWLSARTGLPIDFQFQRQTQANEHHKGRRNALGFRFAKEDASGEKGNG